MIRAAELPVVATIDSTKVSIDLTHADVVIYAELVYDLAALVQSLGRFHRISGSHNVLVQFLIDPDEDHAAKNIHRKVEAISSVFKAGVSEEGAKAIKPPSLTDDEWDEVLSALAESFTGIEATEF